MSRRGHTARASQQPDPSFIKTNSFLIWENIAIDLLGVLEYFF